MSSGFDLSPSERQIAEQRALRRNELRQQFLKLKSNPFIQAKGEGGTVFDPAFLKYQALQVSGFEYFKPSGKNAVTGLFFMVIPMAGLFYAMYTSKNAQEARYRRGEVAYKDRDFKFI
ncbi:uncharacterized protein LOC130444544 [Diorhabda sublineata]|uniref:uncharacterized protein LOC130444544 n=1 Tax=Diorhabda sublineata TaxID=1163346 RepID=UPI0024E0EC36|nr:uncharacterized protein LOC130444544 [Diorhabda sublineata]